MVKPDIPRSGSDSYEPSFGNVPRCDPSVRLGPLQGPMNGEVALEDTMRKPQAFKPNRFNKDMK